MRTKTTSKILSETSEETKEKVRNNANDLINKKMYQEFRKKTTIKAKLFEKGDECGMTIPENFTMLDAMENDRYGCGQPDLVPYVSTLENQKHHGEFGKHYICLGIDGERWLVDKDIFERTYELVS